jgi:hypothetical protein
MRKGKGAGNEEQQGGGELQRWKGAAAKNKTGAGAQGTRTAIAKVKTAVSPSPQIYKPRAGSPERTSRAHKLQGESFLTDGRAPPRLWRPRHR